jgi:hypothetical protein
MIKERNSLLWYKLNGALRHLVSRVVSPVIGSNLVLTEYPKSGGSWICQMLAELMEMEFPRNRLPTFTNTIIQAHYLNGLLIKKPVVVYRDGRDVMVSLYHYSMFVNEKNNKRFVQHARDIAKFSNPEDIRANMPEFIRLAFNNKITRFNWAEFVRSWIKREDAIPVRYEDMIRDTQNELSDLILKISGSMPDNHRLIQVVEKYSFESQSGRKRGVEKNNSFLRKGIAGDWKNKFSQEALDVFNSYARNELTTLGYEIVDVAQ